MNNCDPKSQWLPLESPREIFKSRVITLCAENCKCLRTGAVHEFITCRTCDWVNIVAVTKQHELVLIRQFRHGTRETEREIPGGCIDRTDPSPVEAGIRELMEETGFAGKNARVIGRVHPNPALQGNYCHTILVEEAERVSEPRLEPTECIVTELVPEQKVREMMRDGTIEHGLVLNALMFYFMEKSK
ncbi:MAG: NUDIX hydrolase [bacterium]|nr:NUDIX hydrolase [bacterium]